MATLSEIEANRIKGLSTKFFYRNDALCYQIVLKYGEKPTFFYKEFHTYEAFRNYHDAIIRAMREEVLIPNDFEMA